MNETGEPILVASFNKVYTTSTQNFSTTELNNLGARRGDLVFFVYYGNNTTITNNSPNVNSPYSGQVLWEVNQNLGDGGSPDIALRIHFCVFNGTWSSTFTFTASPPTSGAQGCGIVVYRFSDSTTFIHTDQSNALLTGVYPTTPYPAYAGGSAAITTRNGAVTTAANDITLEKYKALNDGRASYLYFMAIAGGSSAASTAITLNIVTNDGWTQDAEFIHSRSGVAYTRVRIYTIKRSANFASSTDMPTFVFDRTNGVGHYLCATVFFSDQYSKPNDFDYLLVGGGGKGGDSANFGGIYGNGAGGGGGGVIQGTFTPSPGATYSITIGSGGSAGSAAQDTLAFGLTAFAGGAGANFFYDGVAQSGATGGNGGCGGGASGDNKGGGQPVSGQGFPGGSSADVAGPTVNYAAGGGGAGATGGDSGVSSSGVGGAGFPSSINGAAISYGGGGGGAAASGGAGGGGAGGVITGATGGNGVIVGGGGGGGSVTVGGAIAYPGGNGGSGRVVIRYTGASRFTGGVITVREINGVLFTYHTFTVSATLRPI